MRRLGFLACLLPALGTAQQPVEDLVSRFMAKHEIPGLAVAVVQKGKVVYRRGFGFADLNTSTPVTPDTIFPLASLSKPLIAMAALRLFDEGKLNLLDPVSKYVSGTPESWQDIPIRMIMDHTSGVPDHYNNVTLQPKADESLSSDEVIKRLTSLPLVTSTGQRFEYANGNYTLLAKVIDNITKQSQAQYLTASIFRPLQMTNTAIMDRAWLTKCATGYTKAPQAPKLAEPVNPDWLYGCGQIVSSVNDLAKWDASLTSERILRRSTLQMYATDQKLPDGRKVGYSLGWILESVNGIRSIAHNGRLPGYHSVFTRYPDQQVSLAILCNNGDLSFDLSTLSRSIAALLIPQLSTRHIEPVADDFPALTKVHRNFLEMVLTNTIDNTLINEAIQKDFLPVKRKQMADAFMQGGPIISFELASRTRNDAKGTTSKYRLAQKERDILLSIVCDATGLIIGMFYEIA